MPARRSHLVALSLLALFAGRAAHGSGVLALNNKAHAGWTLVLPEPAPGEPSAGIIQVEVMGQVVASLKPGQRYALPAGFRGLLVFQMEDEKFQLRMKLEDPNKQFQAYSIYRDPNFHDTPHVTQAANSVFDTFELSSVTRERLAAILDYDPKQYSLSILADAFPARPRSPAP